MKNLKLLIPLLLLNQTAICAEMVTPKLILQITIDQFSGNQLDRFKKHLTKDGFSTIIQNGLWYDNAHHPHATTQTAVGHTTIATGSVPAVHGVIANDWWDRKTQKETYSMSDPNHLIIGDTSKNKEENGRSPANILAPSFADSLALATHHQSKRFAISTKDRGAIPLAGKMGTAFWFNRDNGQYVTSDYYYATYPKWVIDWNKRHLADKKLNQSWQLTLPCKQYLYCKDARKHFKTTYKNFGAQFPHFYGNQLNKDYYRNLEVSPAGDALLLSFAESLITNEKLGKHQETDYLSISLSATDAIGHTYGPNSLESEDNFVRLNKRLDSFLSFVDKNIGLKNTLIVLSADHGVSPSPTYLKQYNYPAFEINSKSFPNNKHIQKYLKKYDLNWQQLVVDDYPDFYLNDAYLKKKKLNKQKVAKDLSKALQKIKGIYRAVPTHAISNKRFLQPLLQQALLNQIHTKRSGDIYLIPAPYTYVSPEPYTKVHHGTPWAYDTHVPIIFSHPSFKPKRLHQKVFTTSIAPTLTVITHSPPLAASQDIPLKEFN